MLSWQLVSNHYNERQANMATNRVSKAAAKAAVAKAEKAKAAERPTARVLPAAPKGWSAIDKAGAFVRYARRVRATGVAVSAFDCDNATTPSERARVAAFRKAGHDGRYVVVAHEPNGDVVLASEPVWARAYAASMGMGGRPLAPSVQRSITPKAKAEQVAAAQATTAGSNARKANAASRSRKARTTKAA